MKRTVMYDGMEHFPNAAAKAEEISDVVMEWLSEPRTVQWLFDYWCRAGIIIETGPHTYRLVNDATA